VQKRRLEADEREVEKVTDRMSRRSHEWERTSPRSSH
jgi:hypothetical protein